jgi:murein DD-endopeptidase MepM/ murein hydrolase activator NlpD
MMTHLTRRKVTLILVILALLSGLALSLLFTREHTYAASHYQTVPPVAAVYMPLINQQAAPTGTATTIYIVQPGDTLAAIARRFGTTISVLVQLNNLTNPNLIRPGQQLLVPTTSATPTATPTTAPGSPTPTPTATSTAVWSPPASQIEAFSPVSDGLYHSPIEVIGFSQTFEGSVNLRLTAADGTVLAERHTIGGSVDGFDFFHTYLRFTASEQITATLEVFEISANDGSEIHKVTIPLRLLPGQRVVDVHAPTVGATVCAPVMVSGYSNTFEAFVSVDLSARNGTVITQTSAMGGNLGVYADFTTSIAHTVTTPQPVLAGAYEAAASGLGLVDQVRIPVALFPAGSSECP